ncbi:hypothetical protein IW140_001117 [Coemansia sp. RSA 1813]|nr:hypothetical protein IW140_001117 [Coemansia sp. RSA 1813]
MQRTVKPETSRSMTSVPYQQSPSLVSLPMLTRPSTSGVGVPTLALQSSPGNFKRPRVNSKAAGIGSLFRAKMHSKRNSNGGESVSPQLGPQEPHEGVWGDVGIDYPGAMSPLFTDESLEQLLGSSPQLSSQLSVGPSSPASSTSPMSASTNGASIHTSLSPSAAASRRTKREIAASVLHNSAGPFRRLRSGPASKTMSFPPAVGEPTLYQQSAATDEFVVVTSDMCPPASLVSSSVISGVSSTDASSSAVAAAAAAVAASSTATSGAGASSSSMAISSSLNNSLGAFGNGSDHALYPALGTSNRGVTPRLNKPLGKYGNLPLRARAQTQVSKSTEHLLLRGHTYVESTDSLVRITTPSLSTSSSETSLPLGQVPPSTQGSHLSNQTQMRKRLPSSLNSSTPSNSQNSLQLSQGSAHGSSGTGTKMHLPRNAYVLSPPPKGSKIAGSPRKASECSFSSLEDNRRMPHLGQFDVLSPYTVDRLNTTAAKASERRRRSSAHRARRSRTNSAASSVHWGLSATSDMTLLAESARSDHMRNISDASELSLEYTMPRNHAQSFDFQIKSAVSETFWPPGESPLLSDGGADEDDDDELERQLEAGGFPSSCSANFNFEVGRDTGSPCRSPRRQAHERGHFVTRSADDIERVTRGTYAQNRYDVTSFMDPSSPTNGEARQLVTLNLLANPANGRARARTSVIAESDHGFARDLVDDDSELSPHIPDFLDYDGSTLTQPQDWQLMDASSSDNEEQSQNSHPRRRVRKRRVLPKTLFHVPPKNGKLAELVTDDMLYRGSQSSETLLPGLDERSSESATKNDSHKRLQRLVPKKVGRVPTIPINADATALNTTSINAETTGNGAVAETVAVATITPEMQMFIDLEVIPRVPESIATRFRIEALGRLVLYSSGEDHSSWTGRRISCFSIRLAACIERAHGLCELSLVNIGLSKIPKTVTRCYGLRRLNMSHNWISTVPGWLAQLGRLEHIVLAGNPLRMVAADLVEMRHRLVTLNLGPSNRWTVLNRQTPRPRKLSEADRKDILFRSIQATASRRMAACLDAPSLDLTHRQHEASVERAQKLISIYANTLYSTLRQPRNWGHSVALPYPVDHNNHWLA